MAPSNCWWSSPPSYITSILPPSSTWPYFFVSSVSSPFLSFYKRCTLIWDIHLKIYLKMQRFSHSKYLQRSYSKISSHSEVPCAQNFWEHCSTHYTIPLIKTFSYWLASERGDKYFILLETLRSYSYKCGPPEGMWRWNGTRFYLVKFQNLVI